MSNIGSSSSRQYVIGRCRKWSEGGEYMVGWGSSWAGWLRQVNGVSMLDADRRLKTQDHRLKTED